MLLRLRYYMFVLFDFSLDTAGVRRSPGSVAG